MTNNPKIYTMLTLYYKPTCPYCQRVLAANETIKAPLTLKDVSRDEVAMDELIAKGGQRQVPFLEDTDRNVSMYESLDIIDYLALHYSNGVVPDTPAPGNVCPVD